MKIQAGADSPDWAAKTAQDVADLVKGVLALADSSSVTEENLEVTFSYIIAGDNNFAVYYAFNSATVAAQNVWGSKNITVIANTYVAAMVKPNLDITRAQMLQKDLASLRKVNAQYDDAVVAATTQAQLDALTFYQNKLNILQTKIQNELKAEVTKILLKAA
jgi:hypothetical protein